MISIASLEYQRVNHGQSMRLVLGMIHESDLTGIALPPRCQCIRICKCCGESVVGVPSKGSIFCEIDQDWGVAKMGAGWLDHGILIYNQWSQLKKCELTESQAVTLGLIEPESCSDAKDATRYCCKTQVSKQSVPPQLWA